MRRSPRYRPGRDARAQFHPPPPAATAIGPRHAVVVGGGIAGVTAAVALAERGVAVTLIEREDTLGGRVRSWPVTLADGSSERMSRGFHAFFRQYYNLRALLRRIDPQLGFLRPIEDYPLVRDGGGRDSFAGVPRTPPWNLAAFVARSPSFDLPGLARVDVGAALGLLDVGFPELFEQMDGRSAADVLDELRFPEPARHLALEVFARSFFADPREFSGGELVAMFHTYFLGSAEGLLFDVPRDDYDRTLWAPLRRVLAGLGARVLSGRAAQAVTADEDGALAVQYGDESLEADAVVIALDPVGLRELVATSTDLSRTAEGARWCEQVAAVRSAPPFAVWRLWLDTPVDADRPAFLGTSGFGPLDNVSVLERFEDHAAHWSARTGGSVVEVHGYALPEPVDVAATQRQLLDALHVVYPETRHASVVDDAWLLENDCVLIGTEPHASRPGVRTPDPRIVLAGDLVRCGLPVALMERAATTGWQAADQLLAGWGLPGHGVWSVPLTGRLGVWPGRVRRLLGSVG